MNRKDRRAAGKQGKGVGPAGGSASILRPWGPPGVPPPSASANLFAAAARHMGAGQLADAERFCREALTLASKVRFEALYLRRSSIGFDALILIWTIRALFSKRGAY